MCSWRRVSEDEYPAPQEVVNYADWVAAQRLDEVVAASQAAGGSQAASAPPQAAVEAGASGSVPTDEPG
jgi:hypothetical protein